jgi:hypothetical protein
MLRINFWAKDTGNLMNHSSGLTQEQVLALRELKEGDRIILWHNTVKEARDASYTMKMYKPTVNKEEK